MRFKPSITQRLRQETVHQQQYKRRSWLNINIGLIFTILWGILETTILRIIGQIEKVWPQAHNRFMKLMHGLFGGVVTPFEMALENKPGKRNFKHRTPIEKISRDKIFLKKGEMVILPNEEILQLVLRSNARTTVSYCFCRMYAKEQGKPCLMNAPIRTCLTLSFPQPIDLIAQKEPREDLKKEEEVLYKLFKRCDEIGLVHQAIWIPSPNYTYVICNCCPCCCEVLSSRMELKKEIQYHKKQLGKYRSKLKKLENNRSQVEPDLEKYDMKNLNQSIKFVRKQIKAHQKGADMELSPIVARSAFVAKSNYENICIDCGKCVERCYFDARTMAHGKMHYDEDHCYGCGLCVSTCPENNITLMRRKEPKLIGKGKKKVITHSHPHHSH